MSKYITLKQLREAGACAPELEKFEELFGSRMYVSARRTLEAAEAGLDVDCAAQELLSADARAAYRRIRAPALAEYERITDDAWAEYERIVAVTFARLYREG